MALGNKKEALGMPATESDRFAYDTSDKKGKPLTTHQWYNGTQHPRDTDQGLWSGRNDSDLF